MSMARPSLIHQVILEFLDNKSKYELMKSIENYIGMFGHFMNLSAINTEKSLEKLVNISDIMMNIRRKPTGTSLNEVKWIETPQNLQEYTDTLDKVLKDFEELESKESLKLAPL